MAAPEVTLTDEKKFEISTIIEVPEGETSIVINLPGTGVPAGKKARVRLRVEAQLVDAT